MDGRYFATFSSREFELRAFEELEKSAKDNIAPVVTLRRGDRATSFAPALEAVLAAATGSEAIIDFNPEPVEIKSAAEAEEARRKKAARKREEPKKLSDRTLAYHAILRDEKVQFNAMLATLTGDPIKGGERWIELTAAVPNVRPIVQLKTPDAVVAQARRADVLGQAVAFRPSANRPDELELTIQGLLSLADPAASVLLLEAGHRRSEVDITVRRVEAALQMLERRLGATFAEMRKVVVAGSFPEGSLRNQPRALDVEELSIYRALSGNWDVGYGDHCSIQPRSLQAGGSGFFPHVDLATRSQWHIDLVERNRDPAGYAEAAQRVVGTAEWRTRRDCWGTRIIEHAAEGRLVHDDIKMTVPGPWLAVRMNQHMTRRARD